MFSISLLSSSAMLEFVLLGFYSKTANKTLTEMFVNGDCLLQAKVFPERRFFAGYVISE